MVGVVRLLGIGVVLYSVGLFVLGLTSLFYSTAVGALIKSENVYFRGPGFPGVPFASDPGRGTAGKEVVYEYAVDGKTYRNDVYGYGLTDLTFSLVAGGVLDNVNAGDNVDIYYFATCPRISVLVKGVDWLGAILGAVSGLFLIWPARIAEMLFRN